MSTQTTAKPSRMLPSVPQASDPMEIVNKAVNRARRHLAKPLKHWEGVTSLPLRDASQVITPASYNQCLPEVEKKSTIHFTVPRSTKTRWVKAARGRRLEDWIVDIITHAVDCTDALNGNFKKDAIRFPKEMNWPPRVTRIDP